jgi:uncharacterized membrane protein YgdD (TMEM256/DUF423 family)
MTSNRILTIAAVSGGLAVGLGAFGAHGLKELVPAEDLATWETAVRYQAWHALALLACALLAPARRVAPAAWCLALGSLVFSGTLYVLVLTDARWLGAITPIGGVLMIVGWLLLATVRRS